ncbi:MAG TPA: hypothetical protein DF383_07300 [Deltaproteobacteria bacterium]|nr:hypothetical protein [Deltaproteobacteria bacterium]
MRFRGFRFFLFILTMGGCLSASHAAARSYIIDRTKSSMLVFTDSAGIFKSFGHKLAIEVREFSGTAQFDASAPERSSLQMKVATHSLALKTEVSPMDRQNIEIRMHEKVLQTLRFPEIVFVSDTVEAKRVSPTLWKVVLYGQLSLHGVTRRFPIPATVTFKNGQLEAVGEFPIKQSDFKIKSYSYTGGALKVADTVKISFHIVAHP